MIGMVAGGDGTGASEDTIGVEAGVLLARTQELLARAAQRGVAARVFGGTAVLMLLGDRMPPGCSRVPGDIDIAAPASARRELTAATLEAGFVADREFNALHGAERLLFRHPDGIKLDVVLDRLRMCHVIPLEGGFTTPGPTLPASLLLLTKLQVVELTEKDRLDTVALLAGCDIDELGAPEVARQCAADWGLWRTVTGSLDAVTAEPPPLRSTERERMARSVATLRADLERAPKSLRWKARARVGERVRWYEVPEEP